MRRSIVMATVKVGVMTKSRILGRRVIAGKLKFEVISNRHFIIILYIGMLSWKL